MVVAIVDIRLTNGSKKKPRIQQLYIQADLTQKDVINLLRKEGFHVSYVVLFPITEIVSEAETNPGRSS